jgi:DNA polymerase III epsilon subunit-like protein
VPGLVEFLKGSCREEKRIFAGYKCDFDYGHMAALLFRHGRGDLMDDLINGRLMDVYEKVKEAAKQLPRTQNQKLETMTKALGIEHTGAHGALSDIRATRRLYEAIYIITRRKGNEN